MKRIVAFAVLVWAFALLNFASAQLRVDAHQNSDNLEAEAGLPFLQNFSFEDYNAHPQNWEILQDELGIMYIANTEGLLEYDGVTWRLLTPLRNTTVVSLALDSAGVLFAGGLNDFGYFPPGRREPQQFVSLVDKLSLKHRNFGLVWQTVTTSSGTYFRTKDYLIRWTNGELKIWLPQTSFQRCYAIGDQFFVSQNGYGLTQMVGDSLQFVSGSERFASDRIESMLPFPSSETHAGDTTSILICSGKQGLFRYHDSQMLPFPTEADDFLRKNRIYHGTILPDRSIALGTARGGVAIIGFDGRLRHILNKTTGLADNNVHFVYSDHQRGLWISFNNGIARVEIPSPFSVFNQASGLSGTVYTTLRHQGRLYAGTSSGVFYLQPQPDGGLPQFIPVEGIPLKCWSLLSAGNDLLAACSEGLFRIRDNQAVAIKKVNSSFLYRSQRNSSRIYVGLRSGLAQLQQTEKRWEYLGPLKGISEEILTIAEENKGVFWLSTRFQGVLRIQESESSSTAGLASQPEITRFGQEDGLPDGFVNAFSVNGKIVFATNKGLYRFDEQRVHFVPDSSYGAIFADSSTTVTELIAEPTGILWIVSTAKGMEIARGLPQGNGTYRWETSPFRRLRDFYLDVQIYPEPNGAVWFSNRATIVRWDPGIEKNYRTSFPALVRRVSAGDSTIFNGAFAKTGLPGQADSPRAEPNAEIITLKYNNNSLRFEFSACSYDEITANRFRTQLQGFDTGWSPWSVETRRDYTNLPEGRYRFRVAAENIYGQESGTGIFAFEILPPWYRSRWAYSLYLILFLGVTSAVTLVYNKYHTRQLETRQRYLEEIVDERTAEIVAQKNKIEEQKDQLVAQSEKLRELDRMKSRFFANISHEFRTPLTLILGPLEERIAKAKKKADKEEFGLMHRNANRLLQLINQLLDLSSLESGKMKLNARRGDFVAFLKGIVMSFASLAEQKKTTLQFEPCEGFEPSQGFELYFDPDKIEKIFTNLLSNAFKFTPEGGAVSVVVDTPLIPPQGGTKGGVFPSRGELKGGVSGLIQITVSDTGIGIAADRLPHIFDRFYQADDTSTRTYEGTGIGLALTKELVELHHGSIEVESKEGRGTTFTVLLPLGKEHLDQEEIVDTPLIPPRGGTEGGVVAGQEPHTEFKPKGQHPASRSENVILIVDDHPDVRRYVRAQLEAEYQIVEAEDGQQGFESAMEVVPDLVISDVMMPNMDGYQLCESLKTNEKTSHVPVILLTAKAGEADKLSGLETGADDYINKPFNSKELKARVHNLIESRRKLRQRFRREGLLQPRQTDITSTEEAFIQKLMTIIENNLAEEDFHPDVLSKNLHMSLRQLQRKTRALTGQTPSDFIRTVRLQRAKQMLEQHAGTVSEIAFQVGFNDLSYFSKCFRKEFGRLPSEVG